MTADLYITHYGNARIYDTVATVMQSEFSWRFFTSYYHDEAGLAARLAHKLPLGLSARLQRFFGRRHHPALDPRCVESSLRVSRENSGSTIEILFRGNRRFFHPDDDQQLQGSADQP